MSGCQGVTSANVVRLCCDTTSNMATATRGAEAFPLFDRVYDLSDKQLPTHEDIIKCINYRKSAMKKISGDKDP